MPNNFFSTTNFSLLPNHPHPPPLLVFTRSLHFAPPLSATWPPLAPPGGTEDLQCWYSVSSVSSTTLVEERMCRKPCRIALYVLYIWNKDCILFKSRLCFRLCSAPRWSNSGVCSEPFRTTEWTLKLEKTTTIKKNEQFICKYKGSNLQFPVCQTPCWLLSRSKQTINT